MKLIFISGLPGSGKSFLGRKLAEELQSEFIDDIGQTVGISGLKKPFITKIVTDPSLCLVANRVAAEKLLEKYHPGCEIEWVFLTNDPERCWKNVENRQDGRIISKYAIFDLSKKYEIPEGANQIPCYTPQPEL